MTNEELALIAERPTCCWPFGESVSLSRAERDQLAALARDGMRYRCIRPGDALVWCQAGDDLLEGDELDSAIDALIMAKEEA